MTDKPSKYEAGTEGDGTTAYTRTNIDADTSDATPAAEEKPKKRGRRSTSEEE